MTMRDGDAVSGPTIDEVTGTWDHALLPSNVRLGLDVFIERKDSFRRFRSQRDPGVVLGQDVVAYTWTDFSVEPAGCVEIGDRSVLVGAVFMCAERITVGADVVISYGVTIADCDFHPVDPDLRRQDALAIAPGGDESRRVPISTAPVTIAARAKVGMGCIILKGVEIGEDAVIEPGSVVTRSVPAGMRAGGNPAEVLGPVAP